MEFMISAHFFYIIPSLFMLSGSVQPLSQLSGFWYMVGQVVDYICAKFEVDPSCSFHVRAVFLTISRFSSLLFSGLWGATFVNHKGLSVVPYLEQIWEAYDFIAKNRAASEKFWQRIDTWLWEL